MQENSDYRKVQPFSSWNTGLHRAVVIATPHSMTHRAEYSDCCADISELNLQKGMSIKFPEGKDKLLHFEITMKPDEGIYM